MNLNRFNQLLESKIGNVKPLILEDETTSASTNTSEVTMDKINSILGVLYRTNMNDNAKFGYDDMFSFASDKKELFSKVQELRDSNSTNLDSIPQELENLLSKVMEKLKSATIDEVKDFINVGKTVKQIY